MTYHTMIQKIAIRENTTPHEIERKMQLALRLAGLHCSPEEFIQLAATMARKGRYIV